MAIVTRYFSTTSAGATDGTTWANRAALFTAGVWSPVLITFAFNGTDSLTCVIGPGSYTCGAQLAAGLFANPPSVANPLVMSACDSSGVSLAIPNAGWFPSQAAWDDTTLPVIATTTNVGTLGLANSSFHLIKLTASGRNGSIVSAGAFSWCVVINSTSNTATLAGSNSAFAGVGCVFKCTGSAYSAVISGPTGLVRSRVEGVTGSSGTRHGVLGSGTTATLSDVAIFGVGGDGVNVSSANVAASYKFTNCSVVNVGGTGIKPNSTAAQTALFEIHGCQITGCGAYGIDAQSAANVLATSNRVRDNASGNFGNMGNYPTDLNNHTTDSDDATEYLDVSSGDIRIKNSAATFGKGFGVSDGPAVTTGRRHIIGG